MLVLAYQIVTSAGFQKAVWVDRKVPIMGVYLLAAGIGAISAVGLVAFSHWKQTPGDQEPPAVRHPENEERTERELKAAIAAFIGRGENVQSDFWNELRLRRLGQTSEEAVEKRRRDIEQCREDLAALLHGQTVLRSEVVGFVMTKSGDRIDGSIKNLRRVLEDWAKWKR